MKVCRYIKKENGGRTYHKWWLNFDDENPYRGIEHLKKLLEPYRARYITVDPYYGWLEFDSEHDYLLFVMRWS